MEVKVLNEAGYDEALLGISLSFNQPLENMSRVASKLAHRDGGHNKFLESLVVWLDIEAPRYWWMEFDTYRVGTTKQSECYDEQTEVMTDKGWKFFKDITKNDWFLTIDPSNKEISYQTPLKITKDYYVGEMISIQSKKLDLLVTPNHRMWVTNKGGSNDTTKFIKAKDFNQSYWIPKEGKWAGREQDYFTLPQLENKWYTGYREARSLWPEKKIPMDDWLRFLGIYLSQGNAGKHGRNYVVQVTHNQYDGTAEKINALFERLGFNFNVLREDNKKTYRWTISNRQLFEYVRLFGKSRNKFIPRWMKNNLSYRQLRILYEWLHKGDGTKDQSGQGYILYSTFSPQLADDVQEIGIKLGKMHNIYSRRYGTHFTVNKQKTRYYSAQNQHIEKVNYAGWVYCATVPNGTLLVRRNGRATWCGNSTMHTILRSYLSQDNFEDEVYSCTLEALNADIESKEFQKVKDNLPESFLQRRIVCTNYKTLRNIFIQRANHKLELWRIFIKEVRNQINHPRLLPSLDELKKGGN